MAALQHRMAKEAIGALPQRIPVGIGGDAGRAGLVMQHLGLDAIELFPDGNVVSQLELLRPDPDLARHVTRRQGEEGAHEGVGDGREEHEEVDLGEHVLDVLVPIAGVGLGQVDGEFHDAEGGQLAVQKVQHRLGEGPPDGPAVDPVPHQLHRNDEAHGDEGHGQDGVVVFGVLVLVVVVATENGGGGGGIGPIFWFRLLLAIVIEGRHDCMQWTCSCRVAAQVQEARARREGTSLE